jgi:DNA invertase Pin-like site-specific DNA recombinase
MISPKARKSPVAGRLIGYARVSTDEQGTDPQLDELRAAGCATILEEHASGADRSRPVLARLLHEIRAGETLVVVRLDRLARSVSHLLAVIEQLEAAGAHFRSLRDPIDTTTPQGMFSLQVLGAVAQLERALIAERTKAGLRAARSRGRVGGNPGLRARDPDAIRKVRASRDAAYLDAVLAQAESWLPIVRRMRPGQPWGDVVRVLNRGQTASGSGPGEAMDRRAVAPHGAAAGRRRHHRGRFAGPRAAPAERRPAGPAGRRHQGGRARSHAPANRRPA